MTPDLAATLDEIHQEMREILVDAASDAEELAAETLRHAEALRDLRACRAKTRERMLALARRLADLSAAQRRPPRPHLVISNPERTP